MSKKVAVQDIIAFLGSDALAVYGDPSEYLVTKPCAIDNGSSDALDWINSTVKNPQSMAEKSISKVIIANNEVVFSSVMQDKKKILITVSDPRTSIARVGNKFFLPIQEPGIHPLAFIDQDAEIDATATIGAYAIIGKCVIGKRSVVEAGSVIHDGVSIGEDVLIHSGAIIGTEGLGCFRDGDGKLTKFPHLGNLIICDNVEIGANCSIAKGAFADTIIGKGTKINSLCFIAHNCVIGENVLITGCSMLNGSVRLGSNVTVYSNVIIREQRIVGEGSVIGMGSVVTKNIPDYEIWLGNPARFHAFVDRENLG
jgi:UDP-3-O-[3-hydroxymyristoyl] glucosamine N-acyltransferase